jgi:hypothetical protein
MTKQTKIILAVIGGVLVLCLLCGVAGFAIFAIAGRTLATNVAQSVEEDPQKARQVGDEIATFNLPEGYTDATSFDMLGLKFVVWEHESGQSTIILLQMPIQSELSEQTIRQMEDAMRQRAPGDLRNVETIEERDLTVRGQPASLLVREGEEANSGERYQQMMLAFQGKGGVAMLMAYMPASPQNQALYEDIIQSIR